MGRCYIMARYETLDDSAATLGNGFGCGNDDDYGNPNTGGSEHSYLVNCFYNFSAGDNYGDGALFGYGQSTSPMGNIGNGEQREHLQYRQVAHDIIYDYSGKLGNALLYMTKREYTLQMLRKDIKQ